MDDKLEGALGLREEEKIDKAGVILIPSQIWTVGSEQTSLELRVHCVWM